MSELVAFLEARLAEDEAVARAGLHTSDCTRLDNGDDDSWCMCDYGARVLREVTAKRAILAAYVTVAEASERNTAEHTRASAGWPDTQDRIYQFRTHGWQLSGRLEGLEVALRALAAPFSDHPDFQEQWR